MCLSVAGCAGSNVSQSSSDDCGIDELSVELMDDGTLAVLVRYSEQVTDNYRDALAYREAAIAAQQMGFSHILVEFRGAMNSSYRYRPPLQNCIGRHNCDERFMRPRVNEASPVCRISLYQVFRSEEDVLPEFALPVEVVMSQYENLEELLDVEN